MTKTEILKVIRAHCLDCCWDQPSEVANCGCTTCNLYALRFGKDPNPRVLSPEEKERRANLLRATVKKRGKQQDAGASAGQEGGNT